MHSPRVYFNNTGSICTDSLRHGNGLSALLLVTRAAKSSAAKISAAIIYNSIVICRHITIRTSASEPRSAKKVAAKKDSDVDVSTFPPEL